MEKFALAAFIVWGLGLWLGFQVVFVGLGDELPGRVLAARVVFWPITVAVFLWRGCREAWKS